MLEILYRNRNQAVAKKQIVNEIWNERDPKMKERSLREKLALAPSIRLTTAQLQNPVLSRSNRPQV
jgi:DNA-binding response OmpR family regulator